MHKAELGISIFKDFYILLPSPEFEYFLVLLITCPCYVPIRSRHYRCNNLTHLLTHVQPSHIFSFLTEIKLWPETLIQSFTHSLTHDLIVGSQWVNIRYAFRVHLLKTFDAMNLITCFQILNFLWRQVSVKLGCGWVWPLIIGSQSVRTTFLYRSRSAFLSSSAICSSFCAVVSFINYISVLKNSRWVASSLFISCFNVSNISLKLVNNFFRSVMWPLWAVFSCWWKIPPVLGSIIFSISMSLPGSVIVLGNDDRVDLRVATLESSSVVFIVFR